MVTRVASTQLQVGIGLSGGVVDWFPQTNVNVGRRMLASLKLELNYYECILLIYGW